jgi:arylformamidase
LSEALIWRGYTQAELDIQYNSRGTVPDVSVYLNDYAARTQAAKAQLQCISNLRYGDQADELLDIYPAAKTHAPVMVYLHGGDWRALSKDDSGFAAPAFVAQGAMLVVLDFTLVPHTTLPAMGQQVRRALLWLHQHVAAYGGDPQRIHIAGHSSGANLVGQLLMTDWPAAHSAPADLIKSAVFISGLGDLEPVRLSFRNQQLHLTPEVAAQVSLLKHQPGRVCPLLVAVGQNETADYRRQSRAVADHWRSQGNACELFELPGKHHFDAVLDWADPQSKLFRASCALMGL